MEKMTVDCRGMQCPAPILQIAKVARQAASTPMLVEVLATDNEFPTDLKAWCRTTKAAIHSLTNDNGVHRAVLGLNGARPSEEAPQRPAPSPEPTNGHSAAGAPRSDFPILPPINPPSHPERQQSFPGPAHRPLTPAPPAPPAAFGPIASPAAFAPTAPPVAFPQAASPIPSNDVVDLSGLRAPQPVLRLSQILLDGQRSRLTVHCDDPNFMNDLVSWTTATKISVTSLRLEGRMVVADLVLNGASHIADPTRPLSAPPAQTPAYAGLQFPVLVNEPSTALMPLPQGGVAEGPPRHNRCTILVIHNDFEALMAALLVATTSAAQGMEVVIFFSFWGVNLLRGEQPRTGVHDEKVSFLQRMMKWMMPRGPRRQKMGKMHMAGMGKGMMEYFMKKNNVMNLGELMSSAVEQRVRFMVCTMSMGIMGIQKRDVMDLSNIEFAGVTTFVEQSRGSSMSLVF